VGKIRYKILLIDEDNTSERALKQLAENENLPYDLARVSRISEAKKRLDSQPFDIVISDDLLEDGTAFDILDSLKNTPIVLLTTPTKETAFAETAEAGTCVHLTKDPSENFIKALPRAIEDAIKQSTLKEVLDRKHKDLEAIFDAVPAGMLLVDENMIVRRVNDGVRRMVGKEYLEIINCQIGESLACVNSSSSEKGCGHAITCPLCPIRKTVKTVLDTEQTIADVETSFTLKVEGKEITRWLCVTVQPVTIDGRKHAVAGIGDITERKEAEEKAKELLELKSQLISTITHELRTPLTCMKGSIDNILDGVTGKVKKVQRSYLELTLKNITRLIKIVNQILDIRKLKAGKVSLNIEEADINIIAKEVLATMLSTAKEKSIDLSLKMENQLPKAKIDSGKITQLLINLVSNAIKFTPEKGRVHLSIQCKGGELVFCVSDTGVGIPKKDIGKIFDDFYCVQRSGQVHQGTGLGLAIVKQIVAMHNGRIEVESEVNRSTTFTVSLPLKHAPSASSVEAEQLLESSVVND